jgi:di/tripeptidase
MTLEDQIQNDVEKYLILRDFDYLDIKHSAEVIQDVEQIEKEFDAYAKKISVPYEFRQYHYNRWLFNRLFDKYVR